jgi:phosphoglycolate phosphatase-like HAD superfamily hydrolase
MIRIGLPIPTLYKVGLRAQLVSARITRAVRQFFLADEQEVEFVRDRCIVTRHAEPLPLEPVDLDKFENRYQDLIDLFCVSAKDGANAERSIQYMELQDWFGRNYGLYRGLLIPHLQLRRDEADPFEAIFMHSSLTRAIHADELIAQVQQTRCALEICRAFAERTMV